MKGWRNDHSAHPHAQEDEQNDADDDDKSDLHKTNSGKENM